MISCGNEGDAWVVELHTNEGVISLEIYAREAPSVANSFLRLVESGQLCGAKFVRMVPGFLVECAVDVTRKYGEFVEEVTGTRLHHTGAGVVSCPRLEEGGIAGTRFFVMLGPQPVLDNKCIVFGRVCSGMQIIEKISRLHFASDNFRLYSPVEVRRGVVRRLPKDPRPSSSTAVSVAGALHVRQRCELGTSLLEGLES
ncbi:cyclophilin type peptidyl-prolyl cis-trans [Trypanosoma cruzi cruzi]|nr:cyclophilin type peptidyl-prolyl cis-trans [Trypanosoma cruzi cruzi]